MDTFDLDLQSTTQQEEIHHVVSFVGEDASGKFGIYAHHARMMTCLSYGLATIRYDNDQIDYLAIPGGVLYFKDNRLVVSARHYLRGNDYHVILTALDEELQKEEANITSIKNSLYRLDAEMLKHLWELKRQGHHET